jgi:uncharacterized caspase-like protein
MWATRSLLLAGALAVAAAAQGDDSELDAQFLTPVDVRRLALVVGVENYDGYLPVPNALNDARTIEGALTSAGFEVRFLGNPETSDEILHEVRALAQRAGAEPADVVFFFAGHGFQDGAFNYLVPGKARPNELLEHSVPVTSLLLLLSGGRPAAGSGRPAGVTVVILDACRTTGHVRTPDEASSQTGFATVAAPARGTIVGLAAKYNSPAHSRAQPGDTNSPYTAALGLYIPREALSIEEMFNKVQARVELLTGDEQSPEEVDALGGEFYFRPTESERAAEEAAWHATLDTRQRECAINYLRRYPDSRFVRAALTLAERARDEAGGEECPDI